MADLLVMKVQRAGVSCRALWSWCACKDGLKDQCGTCSLDGPEVCDRQVVEALVDRIVLATQQTDEALQQVRYWQRLSSRLCDTMMR
jgi:hypothetical protein